MAASELILLLANKILTDKTELARLQLENERLQFESHSPSTKLIHRYVALYKDLNDMLQKARQKNKDLLEKSKENRRDLQKMVLDSLNPVFNDENAENAENFENVGNQSGLSVVTDYNPQEIQQEMMSLMLIGTN